jgi:hypothetical protein
MAAAIVIAVRRRRERKFKRTSNTFTQGPTRRGRSAIDPNEVEWEKTLGKLDGVLEMSYLRGESIDYVLGLIAEDARSDGISPHAFKGVLHKLMDEDSHMTITSTDVHSLMDIFDAEKTGMISPPLVEEYWHELQIAREENLPIDPSVSNPVLVDPKLLSLDEDNNDSGNNCFDNPRLPPWWSRRRAAQIYDGRRCQILVAVLISLCFLCNICEAQMVDQGYNRVFVVLELIWCIVFALELALNVYAHPCREFIKNSWNWFDAIVVTMSMYTTVLAKTGIGLSGLDYGQITTLRLVRATRVFRLFKRVKSLHKILYSLETATKDVANTMSVLLMVMATYAIVAVEIFGTKSATADYNKCIYPGYDDDPLYQNCFEMEQHYDETFGTFGKAMNTLLQVLTGDGWSSEIARPILEDAPFAAAAFFISYIIVCALMLMNVVVAILLEKVVENNADEEVAKSFQDEEEKERQLYEDEDDVEDVGIRAKGYKRGSRRSRGSLHYSDGRLKQDLEGHVDRAMRYVICSANRIDKRFERLQRQLSRIKFMRSRVAVCVKLIALRLEEEARCLEFKRETHGDKRGGGDSLSRNRGVKGKHRTGR